MTQTENEMEQDKATPLGKAIAKAQEVNVPAGVEFLNKALQRVRENQIAAERDKWKRRALAFQEGYKDKSFEVTALEIQKMDLLAHGADKVVMRQNKSLKTKLLGVCVERNELKEEADALRARVADLEKVLSMVICNGCHNRIGWNETPTKYGDWTKCSSCRDARAALSKGGSDGGR